MNEKFSIFGGRHALTFLEFSATTDSIELAYRITPPLPEQWQDEPDDTLGVAGPSIFLSAEAVDDLGNEYDDGGGAYGVNTDGTATEGSFSLQPGPSHDARSVTITWSLTCGDQDSVLEVTVPLAQPS
ncbi:hypothetical protein [Streptomyces sp. H27-C3]|uniref:hypothetical protein n=1 Tax=Streptomyces sp. H27-C3 TaxID=3046305 RepID=UPI0024BA4B78|nr:hypothetical protein [Streptomyces sp. H27-C3]MDJ0465460.1 hypothetical protein [Streptomyces sp. H27-C3]